jgi:hypothetical protein
MKQIKIQSIHVCFYFTKKKNIFLSFFFLANSVDNRDSKSLTSPEQSPYIWNRSIQSINNDSQISSKELISEYNGRMISQSTISNNDQLKSKSLFLKLFLQNKI